MKILAHLLACIAAIFLMEVLLPDFVQYQSYLAVVAAGVLLWLVNSLVRPVVKLLTLPLTMVTLGLFSLVVNTLMVLLVDLLVPSISVNGFCAALLLALLVSVLHMLLVKLFREDR